MSVLRKLHLFLGVLFAPMLLFFAVSGAMQMYDLHEKPKGSDYTPPRAIVASSFIHRHQRTENAPRTAGAWTRGFMLAASAGLVLTTLLGLLMAFRFSRSALPVVLCLLAGMAIPAILLLLGR